MVGAHKALGWTLGLGQVIHRLEPIERLIRVTMFPNWLKWTISLALLLTVGVLGIWWAGEIRTKTGSLTAPDFGWLEFWLNRYQTRGPGSTASGPQLHLRLRRELYGSFGLGWVWDGSAEGLGTAANSP